MHLDTGPATIVYPRQPESSRPVGYQITGYCWVYWTAEIKGIDWDAVDQELKSTDPWISTYSYNNKGSRSTRDVKEHSEIHKLSRFIENSKESLLDLAWNENTIKAVQVCWHKGLEYYKQNTKIPVVLYKDSPDFEMGLHVDNNHIIIQVIINLADNGSGTELYTIDQGDPFFKMSGKRGQGLIFVNTHGALHGIRDINQDRYIMYASITHE